MKPQVRVYDSINKRMIYSHELERAINQLKQSCVLLPKHSHDVGVYVMQRVGFTNETEQEIYEKDIIKLPHPNAGYGRKDILEDIYEVVPDIDELLGDEEHYEWLLTGEVVGNTFEHKYILDNYEKALADRQFIHGMENLLTGLGIQTYDSNGKRIKFSQIRQDFEMTVLNHIRKESQLRMDSYMRSQK